MKFPEDFYWGAATSAHQVEGSNRNDWTEWEYANSARLAAEAASRHANAHMRIPDYILERYPNPLQEKNYISGRACDHYNRFKEDFDIAKKLGHNAHRFSIEWSRIEPKEGKFDASEIEHYREVIEALHARGLEPFVTLWHFTNPLWVRDQGGWENSKTIKDFLRYVEKIATAFGREVRFWLTLNEPEIYTANSYLIGIWPPQQKSIRSYLKVLRHLALAHRRVYSSIKEIYPDAQIGIAKNNVYFEGWAASIARWFWNDHFLRKIDGAQDFIGLNCYFHNRIRGLRLNQNENKLVSDMGWEIYPESISHVLKDLKKYNVPIYITENGIADARDIHRAKFIREHLEQVAKAVAEGVDVRGYFYWSLLDNFEWDKGFWPRFGLVEMDYKTMERKIRPSAWEYKKIIETTKNDVIASEPEGERGNPVR